MKNIFKIASLFGAGLLLASASSAQSLIAYWAQNANELAPGVFGFAPASFPQPADEGSGSLSLVNFNTTTGGDHGAYTYIPSFAGSTINALSEYPGGGSLSPQGGLSLSNNGMSIDFSVSTVGFSGISISWAQQGTGTGFDSRVLSYSDDGGDSFTIFDTDLGALGSAALKSHDLSSVTSLDDNANVILRLTLDGATNANGNNRFDNIQINASAVVPEPSTYAALLGLGALGFMFYQRRKA